MHVFIAMFAEMYGKIIAQQSFGCEAFARQQWRAWIETISGFSSALNYASFARQQWRAWIETGSGARNKTQSLWFARQQWRAWIETFVIACPQAGCVVRPPAMAGVD